MPDPSATVDEVFAILEGRSASGDLLDRALERWGATSPLAGLFADPPRQQLAAPAAPSPRPADSPPVSEMRTEASQLLAAHDFAILCKKKGAARRRAVHRSPRRMRSLALVELILSEARKQEGEEAQEWLDCADAVALRIPFTEPEALPRLRLRLRALRADALRVAGDFQGADAIWAEIHEQLAGTPEDDLAAAAERCRFEAWLRRAQRRFDDAEALLERAERLYRQMGDSVGRVRILTQRATHVEYAGDAERALALKEEAAALADPEVDLQLFWTTRQNLANTLLHLGRTREAAELLTAARLFFARCGDPDLTLRLLWHEGRTAGMEGRFDESEQKLRTAAQVCLHRGLHFAFAQISLDLAGLYVSWKRPASARSLAVAIEPLFRCRGLHSGALQALRLLQQAARAERLDGELVAALRRYLEAACEDPVLPFEPPVAHLPSARRTRG